MKHFSKTFCTLACGVLLVLSLPVLGQYNEKYRPQFHFSPNSNWIGDPDGLVKYNGVYHLFWWGHAISTDMVHWTELPYPILGDPSPYSVTTGSAVIDKLNVSGFGTNSMVAFPTLDQPGDQRVGIAVGTNSANNFTDLTLYSNNPVLGPTSNSSDFRDPQVLWDSARNQWAMALARGGQSKIDFYKSDNLKSWQYTGTFGPDGTGGNWETPDLFQLPVDNDVNNKKWVLTIGIGPNKMRYFIGNFDGNTFVNQYPGQIFTMDYGMDFYAARTWRDYDQTQTRTTVLGWMGNWEYSPIAPSKLIYGGLGVQSVPRDLALKTYPEGIRLTQNPIPELQQLRQTAVSFTNKTISDKNPITNYGAFSPTQNVYEFDATFSVNANSVFGFNLCVNNAANKKLIVKYEASTSTLSIDRNNTSDVYINSYFPVTSSANVPAVNNQLRLRILVDKSTVELFANDGKHVLSMLTYAGDNQAGLEVFSQNGSATLLNFTGWKLNSIWTPSFGYKVQSGGIYQIENRHSGKAMDSHGSANFTQLQQWDWLNGPNQKWKVDITDPGYFDSGNNWVPTYYQFTNQGNGKVMDLRDGFYNNGGVVQQYDWVNSDNQKWSLEDAGGGFWKIVSKRTSRERHKVVEVEDASNNNSGKLQTWTFLGYHHQEWKFNLITPPSGSRTGVISPIENTSNPGGNAFLVYPNPSGQQHITVNQADNMNIGQVSDKPLIYGITLSTNTGVIVKNIKNLNGVKSYSISTKGLKKGIYFLSIYSGQKHEIHKVEI